MARLYRSPGSAAVVRRWCEGRLATWGRPHSTTTVTTSLGGTHLVSAGSAERTCLFLPGTNFNAATSLPLLEALAASWTVVCADLPGQPGLSDPARPEDETAGYARWVDEVVGAVRRDATITSGPLVLAGHSRGAAVALSAAPAGVDGLALVCPAGLTRVQISARLLRVTLPWLTRPTPARSRALLRLMTHPDRPEHAAGELEHWMTMVPRTTRTTGAPGPLPEATVARWRGRRVVVLAGECDVFFPPQRLRPAALRLLDRPVEVAPGSGHLLVDEDPDAVAATVNRLTAAGGRW